MTIGRTRTRIRITIRIIIMAMAGPLASIGEVGDGAAVGMEAIMADSMAALTAAGSIAILAADSMEGVADFTANLAEFRLACPSLTAYFAANEAADL